MKRNGKGNKKVIRDLLRCYQEKIKLKSLKLPLACFLLISFCLYVLLAPHDRA